MIVVQIDRQRLTTTAARLARYRFLAKKEYGTISHFLLLEDF
jgi:hypothetical protein